MSDVSDQRRYYERMMDEIVVEYQKPVDRLIVENIRLKELMSDFYTEMRYMLDMGMSPTIPRHIEHDMRELGIEV